MLATNWRVFQRCAFIIYWESFRHTFVFRWVYVEGYLTFCSHFIQHPWNVTPSRGILDSWIRYRSWLVRNGVWSISLRHIFHWIIHPYILNCQWLNCCSHHRGIKAEEVIWTTWYNEDSNRYCIDNGQKFDFPVHFVSPFFSLNIWFSRFLRAFSVYLWEGLDWSKAIVTKRPVGNYRTMIAASERKQERVGSENCKRIYRK